MSSSFDAMQCVRRDTRRAWCRHAGMDATAAMVKWQREHANVSIPRGKF
jgi:hypothetical protein|tara:strand:- start:106 stop:252 length:147 start_codon:yes stop_codon:yes gene_type:complete